MTMIKIDGQKIKQLREQQGLTQLYLATAVEVTTDTISRWENRRYPSIKRENGLKLAEALGVTLETLLEEDESESDGEAVDTEAEIPVHRKKKTSLSRVWPLLVLSFTLLGVLLAFLFYAQQTPEPPSFTASRTLPPHCIAGQPFPIIITVTGTPAAAAALIIKETVPEKVTVLKTSPETTSNTIKNGQIKWLEKVSQSTVFAYIAKAAGDTGREITFAGTAASSNDATSTIQGDSTTVIGSHHWADTNSDNIISDQEILTVYDRYNDIVDLDLDIDLIEEIWLGSGYRWHPETASYEIIE
ncbi:MAG: helix-turn-helix transcriptional regulator [Desulforhopalus sp.]